MERIDKAIISGVGVIILGGGALLGWNMTTDISESTKTEEYTPRISATKSKTTTVTKQKTTEPVVVEPEAPTTETQINDYFFTVTTAVPVAPQPVVPQTTEPKQTVTVPGPKQTITETKTETSTKVIEPPVSPPVDPPVDPPVAPVDADQEDNAEDGTDSEGGE